MNCPRCEAEMTIYDKGVLKEKYACKACGEKVEKNTLTGEVIAIAGALAGIAAIFVGLGK